MDRHGIARAAVLSLRGYARRLARRQRRNIRGRGAPSRPPHPHRDDEPVHERRGRELRRLADAGMRAVRLYPSFHSYALDNEFVDDVCRAAAERSLPVMIPTRP